MDFVFRSLDEKKLQGHEVVFPIVKHVGGKIELIGTGFFICNIGVFVTAKHVLMDVLDDDGNQVHPIAGIQFFGDNKYIIRPVLRCTSNTESDISVGVLAPANHKVTGQPLKNPVLVLTTKPPYIGSDIATFAYPESKLSNLQESIQRLQFQTNAYSGKLEEYHPEGRDSVLLPFPCYRGSMHILSGASGGPVWNEQRRVFGVICTGFDGTDIGYFARIDEIIPLWVNDVNLDGVTIEKVSVKELVNRKQIVFKPPISF